MKKSPWLFFLLVFCWTWFFWISAAALGASVQTTLGTMLLVCGLFGPALGGIVFTCLTGGPDGRRDYWVRIVDPGRIRPGWYLVIFLFVPVLMMIAVLIDLASGGSPAPGQIWERVSQLASAPLVLISFVLRVLIYGPLTEEPGWRGYILDRLQARWNVLTASLILGAIWALWHLPLFFIRDMYHHTQGAWSSWFWLFMLQSVAVTVIFTWIFNHTGCSTLAAILFHFMINITYELVRPTAQVNLYATLLWIFAAAAVVGLWGAGRLNRHVAASHSGKAGNSIIREVV